MTLSELARHYGTDKIDYHSYIPFYEELLKTLKVRTLLEIGVLKGASLRMWRDYLPHAAVFGIDYDDQAMFLSERIFTILADYRATDRLQEVLRGMRFDLIIDDGFHEPEDQIATANALVPLLSPDGVYVIEDVREGNQRMVTEGLRYASRMIEFDIKRLSDDRIIVIGGACSAQAVSH